MKIVALRVHLPNVLEEYRVGKPVILYAEPIGRKTVEGIVTEISDTTYFSDVDYSPEYSIRHERYSVYVDGKLYREIKHNSVTVEYE